MSAFLSNFQRSWTAVTSKERLAVPTAVALVVAAAVLGNEQSQRESFQIVRPSTKCEASTSQRSRSNSGPKLIFLGTGSSSGCPIGVCTLNLAQTVQRFEESSSSPRDAVAFPPSVNKLDTSKCRVSHLAAQGDPKFNKNYRNNPSFLIHHHHPETGTYKNVLIDVGKTFREGAIRWFPEFNIQSLDSIILTHEHMDAAAGLDDVRGFQRYAAVPTDTDPPAGATVLPPPKRIPVPLHLSRHCHDQLQGQFPFLFPKKLGDHHGCCDDPPAPTVTVAETNVTPSKPIVHRDVAGFLVNIFEAYQPIRVEGLNVIPLPVWHGDDLISYGFAFSVPTSNPRKSIHVVYLSDISRMVPETMDFILQKLPPTDILIVDSLLWHRAHPTHFSLEQAVELRDQLKPRIQTYLVGMSCDNYLPHDEMQNYLKATFGDVTMAHDGLVIPLDEV